MIRQNTVFILGAGASQPYGYPTGLGLRKKILHGGAVLKDCLHGNWQRAVDDFITTFQRSSITSIDLFLSRNSEFINIGKPAIVKAIIDGEKGSRFREEMVNPNDPSQDNRKEDWYSFIYQEMTKELTSKNDYQKLAENNVTFISFNYDRSFEHFLAESFVNSFHGIDGEKLYGVLRKIKIIHVYGKIAPLPWEDSEKGISYKQITPQRVMELSKNIHVIGEERDLIDASLKQAQIGEAEKIFFLGFGFAKENLDILNIPGRLNIRHKVFSSGYGFLPEEVINLRSQLTGGIVWKFRGMSPDANKPKPENIVIESGSLCLDVLRKYLWLTDGSYLLHKCKEANGYHF